MKYLFHLGIHPHISIAEISAVFAHHLSIPFTHTTYATTYALFETDAPIDIPSLGAILGGTRMIATQIPSTGSTQQTITDFLHTETSGKIHFSLHCDNAQRMGLSIKKELKAMGHSVRYIEANNTATILHNNLVEKKGDFTIIGTDVFVTESIQDIENFGKRDYDRPGFDEKSGMLPPKLARMMINLSGAHPKTDTLLDAFCGSGTVLMEAGMLGFEKIIGCDVSSKAIEDSKKNVAWICHEYNLHSSIFNLITSDATKLSQNLEAESIDVIISEPYMGKPLRGMESKVTLQIQAGELAELYIDAFTSFHTLLKKNGTIIFVIPQFAFKQEWITIDCIEHIKNIGFKQISFGTESSLIYHRAKQHVRREIFGFRKV